LQPRFKTKTSLVARTNDQRTAAAPMRTMKVSMKTFKQTPNPRLAKNSIRSTKAVATVMLRWKTQVTRNSKQCQNARRRNRRSRTDRRAPAMRRKERSGGEERMVQWLLPMLFEFRCHAWSFGMSSCRVTTPHFLGTSSHGESPIALLGLCPGWSLMD
jgi:hypothetical protein